MGKKASETVKYGCHVNIDLGHVKDAYAYDHCCLDEGMCWCDCTYANKLKAAGEGKENCKFWRKTENAVSAATPEPAPEKGEHSVLDAVMSDLQARSDFGMSKYGTRLMSHNGRNSLLDAYQEALDLVMYLKQRLLEEGICPPSLSK